MVAGATAISEVLVSVSIDHSSSSSLSHFYVGSIWDDSRLHAAQSYTSSPDSPFSLRSSFTQSAHLFFGLPPRLLLCTSIPITHRSVFQLGIFLRSLHPARTGLQCKNACACRFVPMFSSIAKLRSILWRLRTKLCPISFAPCPFPNLAGTLQIIHQCALKLFVYRSFYWLILNKHISIYLVLSCERCVRPGRWRARWARATRTTMTPSSGSTGVGTSRRRRASNASRWVTPCCHTSLGGGAGQATRTGGSRLTWRRCRASNASRWVTPRCHASLGGGAGQAMRAGGSRLAVTPHLEEAQGKQREQVGHASLSRLTWRRRRASNASRWVTPHCHASLGGGAGQATRAGGSRLTVTPHLEEAQGKQREQVGHASLSRLTWRRRRANNANRWVTPHLEEAQGKQREQVGHALLSHLTWRRRRASNANRWVTPHCHASLGGGAGQAMRAGGSRLTVTPHLEEAQGKQREQVGHASLSFFTWSCLTCHALLVMFHLS